MIKVVAVPHCIWTTQYGCTHITTVSCGPQITAVHLHTLRPYLVGHTSRLYSYTHYDRTLRATHHGCTLMYGMCGPHITALRSRADRPSSYLVAELPAKVCSAGIVTVVGDEACEQVAIRTRD
jgi:hypothetical protein